MKQIIIFALLVIAATAQKTSSRAEPDSPRPSRGNRKFNTANVNDELGISSRSSFWNPDGDKQEKKVLSASERATLASQRRNHQSAKPRPTTQVSDNEPVAASSVVAPVIAQQHFLSRREKATRRSDSVLPEDADSQPTFPSRRRPPAPEETSRPESGRRRPPAPVSESIADTPVPPRRASPRRPSAARSAPVEEEEVPASRPRGGRRPSSRQRTEVRARPIPTEASAPAPLTTEAVPPPPAEAFEPLETVSREPATPVAAEIPQPDVAPVVTELSITETELAKAPEVSSTTVKPTIQAQTPAPAQEGAEPRYQGRRGGSGRNRGAQEAKASRRLPQSSRSTAESADEVTPPPAAFSRTGRRNGPGATAAPQAESKRRPPAETPSEPKRRPFRPAPAAAENDVPPVTQEFKRRPAARPAENSEPNDVPPVTQEFKRRPAARPAENSEPNDVPPTLPELRRRPSSRPAAANVEASPGGVDVEPRRSTNRARPVSTSGDARRGGRRGEAPVETAEGASVQRTSRKINADTSPRGGYKQSRRSGVKKLRTTSRPSVSIDDIEEDANYPPEFIKALKLTEDTKVKETSTKSSSQDLDETFVTKSSQTVSSVSILPQSLSEDSQGTEETKSKIINEDLVNKGDVRKRTNKYSRQNRPSRQPLNQENDSVQKVKRLNLLLAPSPPSENTDEQSTKESTITTLRDRYKPSGSYTLRGSKSSRGDDEKKQTNKGESTTLSLQELPAPSSTPSIRNPIASLQAKQGFRFKNLRFSKPKEENDKTVASTTESQVTEDIKTARKSVFPSTTQSNFVSRKRFSSLKRNQETITIKPTEYSESSTRKFKIRSTTSRVTSAFRRSAVATTEAITGDLLPASKLPLTPSSLLGSQKYSARFRSDLLLATGGLRSTSTPAYVPTVPLIRTSTTSETVPTMSSTDISSISTTSPSTQATAKEDNLVKVSSSPPAIVVQPEISNSVYIGKDSKYSNYWSSTTTEKSKFRYVTTNIFSSTFSTTVPSIVTPEQFPESTTKLIFRWKPVVPNVKSDINEAEDAPTTGTITAVDSTSPVTITQSHLSTTDTVKSSVDPVTQLVTGTTISTIQNLKPTNLTTIPPSTTISSVTTQKPTTTTKRTVSPSTIRVSVTTLQQTTQRPTTITTQKTVAPSTVRAPVTTLEQYLIPTSTATTPTFGIRSLISRVLGNGGINAASIQAKPKVPSESTTASASQKDVTNSLTKAVSDDIDNLRLNLSTSTVSAITEKTLSSVTTPKPISGNTQTLTTKSQNSNFVSTEKPKQVTTIKPKPTQKSVANPQKPSTTQKPKISAPSSTTSKPVSIPSAAVPVKNNVTTQRPKTTVKPSTTQKPVTTTKPATTQKSITTTKSSSTQKPVTVTKSTTQKPTSTTKRPVTTQKPVTTSNKPTTNKIVTDPKLLTTTNPLVNQESYTTVEPIKSTKIHNNSENTLTFENILTNLDKRQEITSYDEQFFRSILQQNNKGVTSSRQQVVELANKVIDHASQITKTSTQKSVISTSKYANSGANDIVRDSKTIHLADQNEALASKVIEIAVERATSTVSPSISKNHFTVDLLGQQSSNIKPNDVNDAIIVPSKANTGDTIGKTKSTPNKIQEDQLLAALLGNPLGTENQKATSTRSRLSPEEQLLATLIRTQASAAGSPQKTNKPAISKEEEHLLAALLNSPVKSSPKPIAQVTTPKPKRLLSDEQILAGLLTGSTPSSPLDQARLVELLSGGRHRNKPTTTTTTAVPRGLGLLFGRFRDPNLLTSAVLPNPNESIDPVSETGGDSVDGSRDPREQSNLVKAAIEVTKAVSQFMGAVIQGATRSFQSFFRSGTSLLSNYFAAGSAQAGTF